jgi:hypothetical protein
MFALAAFIKESRMMFNNANHLDRKSGRSPTERFTFSLSSQLFRPNRILHPTNLRPIQIIKVKDHHLVHALL